jgi:phage FluMu gp28-like protein
MYYLGLDLGQKRDFSALALVQREEQRLAWLPIPTTLNIRHLERIPLGTPYAQVIHRVARLITHPSLQFQTQIIVDATGVGAPVVEALRTESRRGAWGAPITAVTITGSETANGSGNNWTVPKKDLLGGLQVLLDHGDLTIPRKLKEAPTLVRELKEIRRHQSSTGRITMGADAPGQHDDLAIAVALACWKAQTKKNTFGPNRLPGI